MQYFSFPPYLGQRFLVHHVKNKFEYENEHINNAEWLLVYVHKSKSTNFKKMFMGFKHIYFELKSHLFQWHLLRRNQIWVLNLHCFAIVLLWHQW